MWLNYSCLYLFALPFLLQVRKILIDFSMYTFKMGIEVWCVYVQNNPAEGGCLS